MDDLKSILDPGLDLPIAGTTYRVECSAWQGLRLHTILGNPQRTLSDVEERAEIIATLGDAYQRMVNDKVPWSVIAHAGRTAMIWFGMSPQLGLAHWECGAGPGNPLPPPPNQAMVVGERMHLILRRRGPMARMIRAVAHTTR